MRGKNKMDVNLRSDLMQFLMAIQSSPSLEKELQSITQLIATRHISNSKKDKTNILILLAILFAGVYPELQTRSNRDLTIRYLANLFN